MFKKHLATQKKIYHPKKLSEGLTYFKNFVKFDYANISFNDYNFNF